MVADWIEYEIAIFQSVASNTTNISDLTVGANATAPLIISPAEFDMTLAAVSEEIDSRGLVAGFGLWEGEHER